jgi:hypothetical protein
MYSPRDNGGVSLSLFRAVYESLSFNFGIISRHFAMATLRSLPTLFAQAVSLSSNVPARLGPKAPALAWPDSRLGPGLAWPKPRLLVRNVSAGGEGCAAW